MNSHYLYYWRRCWCLAATLLVLILLTAAAAAAPSPEPASTMDNALAAEPSCFDRVWHDAHDHPWYLDADGNQVTPEVSHDWLVVQFLEPDESKDAATAFNERYAATFDFFLEGPETTNRMAVYRLRQGLPYGFFEALLQRLRKDPAVQYIQPVWRIDQELYAPLNQIEITWKSATSRPIRERLLAAAGAVADGPAQQPDTQRVRIDPCRRVAWQAAALLAEDLHVVRAVPQLLLIEPPVSITFALDLQGAMAGAPIPFHLHIRFTEGVKIESATIANLNLKPLGIFHNLYEISFDQPLSAIDLSQSPVLISGTLRLYASGEHVLPAIAVYYTDSRSNDRTVRTLRSEVTPIRIAAMVPETPAAYRLQAAPPPPLPPLASPGIGGQRRAGMAMTAAGVILLALAVAGWWQLSPRLAKQRPNEIVHRRQKRLAELTAWTERDPAVMELADWADLGSTLTDFLAEFAGLPADARGGSHTSFLRQLEKRLSATERQQAEAVLQGIDHLLAGGRLVPERLQALLDQTKALLASLESPRNP